MNKLKIAVLFGGCSEEHAVSVKSAREIARNLDPEKFDPLYIGITKSGEWRLCDYPDANWDSGNAIPAMLSPDRKVRGLIVLEQEQGEYKIIRLDVAFPVLHGKMGEDGAIQGLLELAGIPYVGCDIQSSALCMDKSLTYTIVRNAGIAAPEFKAFNKGDRPDAELFDYPVFVKPARSGSSFGVSKASNRDELLTAIEIARQYDSKILIEQTISGSEVGCAVLGTGNDLFVGEVDQIRVSHGFFRIHQEEHPENGSENSTVRVPADLSERDKKRVQETAKLIYRTLGCSGLARVDMFLQEDGRVVLNEVNTMPGWTSYSRYPRMMAAAGLTLADVIDRVVALAMEG